MLEILFVFECSKFNIVCFQKKKKKLLAIEFASHICQDIYKIADEK